MTGPVVRWRFEDYWAGRTRRSTFLYTGSVQHFVIPDGATNLLIAARGAFGGGNVSDGVYLGGLIQGYLPVDDSMDVLDIYVGGLGQSHDSRTAGAGGYNGGGAGGSAGNGYLAGDGGGGETDIRLNGTKLLVAGGAAGNSGNGRRGGAGGPHGLTGWSPSGTAGGKGGSLAPGAGGTGGGAAGSSSTGGKGANNSSRYGAGGGAGGYQPGGGGGLDSGAKAANGGGGGANKIDAFDSTKAILNQYGTLAQSKGALVQPSVQIQYALETDGYTFEINPNDGGTPTMQKNVAITQNTGPNRVNILQEGQSTAPSMEFSGVILTQQHLEALESWHDRRVFIKLTDDLGREMYGVVQSFAPRRVRRPYNPWYHTFDASFAISAYRDASGNWRYGRVS